MKFEDFKGIIKETFDREEIGGIGAYFQEAISAELNSHGKLEIKFMHESSFGANGSSVELTPQAVLALKTVLNKIMIKEPSV